MPTFILMLKPGVSGRLSNKTEINKATNNFFWAAGTIAEVMKGMPGDNTYEFFIRKIDNKL